jgi:hypothetical protein
VSDECTCDQCQKQLQVGEWPYCPHGFPETGLRVVDDTILGGLTIENMGHEPVTVYSHSERRRLMKERGLREQVRHVGLRGSDKSPHTSRWV